jgi:hypothetical protein
MFANADSEHEKADLLKGEGSRLMTPLQQAILASALALQTPGKSIYSRVPLENCDSTCQTTPVCNEPTLLCAAPEYSKSYQKWTVPETYEEGLKRYKIIAEAATNVAERMTYNICKNNCSENDQDCKKDCEYTNPWKWESKQLAYMILVVAKHEAGLRRDVHSGIGSAARGDCKWKDKRTGKPAAPFSKGAAPVAGTCRSVCLMQINIGNGKTVEGWSADDLVGLDLASTERCFTVGARYLAQHRSLCTNYWAKPVRDWAKATFAAYGSGRSCVIYARKADGSLVYNTVNGRSTPVEASWPSVRAQDFWTQYKHPKTLNDNVKNLLGLSELTPDPVLDQTAFEVQLNDSSNSDVKAIQEALNRSIW